MSDSTGGAKPNAKAEAKADEFVYVDADAITYVKRGRKANADPILIEKLKGLPSGKALLIPSMKADPSAADYKTEKARISSQIRTACRAANLNDFRILWSPNGVPQVVR